MDRAGRRPLLLYPMAAMVLVLAVITVAIKYQVKSHSDVLVKCFRHEKHREDDNERHQIE